MWKTGDQEVHGLNPLPTSFVVHHRCKSPQGGIQTWDLTICLCLNLKHGELDYSVTTAGISLPLLRDQIYE